MATAATPMAKARWGCSAAVVAQRLYVAGGCETNKVLRSVECFDNETGRWVLVKPMRHARWGQFLASCDGKLFAVGGGTSDPSSCAEAYDLATNEWRPLPPFASGPRWGSAVVAAGQHLLAVCCLLPSADEQSPAPLLTPVQHVDVWAIYDIQK